MDVKRGLVRQQLQAGGSIGEVVHGHLVYGGGNPIDRLLSQIAGGMWLVQHEVILAALIAFTFLVFSVERQEYQNILKPWDLILAKCVRTKPPLE